MEIEKLFFFGKVEVEKINKQGNPLNTDGFAALVCISITVMT